MINKKVIVGILALLVFLSPVLASPSVLAASTDGGSSGGDGGHHDATGHERPCSYGPDVDNYCKSNQGSANSYVLTSAHGTEASLTAVFS